MKVLPNPSTDPFIHVDEDDDGFYLWWDVERWYTDHGDVEQEYKRIKPRLQPGDVAYVRETCMLVDDMNGPQHVYYRADGEGLPGPWKPSIHMPKRLSRLWAPVLSVRPERVQEITPEDVAREGIDVSKYSTCDDCGHIDITGGFGEDAAGILHCPVCDRTDLVQSSAQAVFGFRWGNVYPGSWESNEWVWRYEFGPWVGSRGGVNA